MTIERDELIELVWEGAVADRVKDGLDPEFTPVVRPKVEALADAILAAGYSKHSAELASAKRAAKTLNEVIEKQCRDVLEVTGLHHLINEDGDGAWDVVWMRLFEMREELKDLKESTIARERKRGDSWRDRAQEMTVRAESAEGRGVLAGEVEWTVFRASDGPNGSPAENLRYSTKAGAQESIDSRYSIPELWEPRSRIVGEWTK